MTDFDAEVVVVGAGVVGAAIAARLAPSRSVVVFERNESYGRETTSHNSGVVHAGIYYPTGSLKHRACIAGNRTLYAWCESHHVAVRRCGKLIVAADEDELEAIEQVAERARANGVPGIRMLSGAEARELEPVVPSRAALLSESTGVVDAIGFTRSLESAAREAGALFVYRHEVAAAARDGGGFAVETVDADGTRGTLRCSALVTAAGHGAPAVAASLGYPLDGGEGLPRMRQAMNRGRWYDVVGGPYVGAVQHLVYPPPEYRAGGLGVHLTVDIDGVLHLGPDTTWLEDGAAIDYRTDDSGREAFLASGRKLLPELRDEDIAPGQVGYRTKLQQPGEESADFLVWHDRGYVHLGGIESPGLTSALALAEMVAEELR